MRPIPMLATTSLLLFATLIPAADVKPAPAVAIRHDLIALKVIAALRANDLEQAFKALPADIQKTAEKKWADIGTANDEGGPVNLMLLMSLSSLDESLQRNRATNAVDDLVQEYTKVIENAADEKAGAVMMLRSSGAQISPMIQELAKKEPKLKGLDSTLVELSLDLANWIETTEVQDPKKLRGFFTEQVAGFKALKIQSSADLRKLSLPQALGSLSPLVKHFKAAMAVYGIPADAFLDSIKITSKDTGKLRDLDITLSAFGKPRKFWLRLQQTDQGWEIDPTLLAPLMPSGLTPEQ